MGWGHAIVAGSLVLGGGCERVLGLTHVTAADASRPVDIAPDSPYGAYVNAVLADRPVGYFRLGETSGVTAQDLTGGQGGTYLGNAKLGAPGALAGDPDTAVVFDGSNGAVQVDRFQFSGNAPFSLEAWIKPVFNAVYDTIAARWAEPPMYIGYDFWQFDTNVGIARDGSAGQQDVIQTGTLVEGAWAHVVATYDGQQLVLYVNGREETSGASKQSLPDPGLPFQIGATDGKPTEATFDGTLDEVAIYDHALSPDRIEAHYQAAALGP